MKTWPMLLLLIPSLCYGWNANRPAGSDTFEVSDDYIRANWAAIEVLLKNIGNPVGFSVSTTGATATITINTGSGAVECYAMNQDVETSDSVTFTNVTTDEINIVGGVSTFTFNSDVASMAGSTASFVLTITGDLVVTDFTASTSSIGVATATTLDTGFGANELYDMDQHVLKASSVTFANVTATTGTIATLDGTTFTAVDLTLSDDLVVGDDGSVGGDLAVTGTIDGATVNTTGSDVECYAMDQDVEEADAVVFATVNTGQGANELYDMDQDVLKASDVTFGLLTSTTIDTGQGATEVYAMDQDVETDDAVQFTSLTVANLNVTASFTSVTATGTNYVVEAIDTGQGLVECYFMNQSVGTISPVIFTTVNTGLGANELYEMDQNVQEADAVVFATVNTGQGVNELYDMDQNVKTDSNVTFAHLTCNSIDSTQDTISGYSLDQDLETTDDVTFAHLTATTIDVSTLNTNSIAWANGWTGWFDDNVYFRVGVDGGLVRAVIASSAGGYESQDTLAMSGDLLRVRHIIDMSINNLRGAADATVGGPIVWKYNAVSVGESAVYAMGRIISDGIGESQSYDDGVHESIGNIVVFASFDDCPTYLCGDWCAMTYVDFGGDTDCIRIPLEGQMCFNTYYMAATSFNSVTYATLYSDYYLSDLGVSPCCSPTPVP